LQFLVTDLYDFSLRRCYFAAINTERQQGPDRHQIKCQQIGLTERQGFKELVSLVDRVHAHQEDDTDFFLPQLELLHLAVEIELQSRWDFLR
jgi:hypothetical protein